MRVCVTFFCFCASRLLSMLYRLLFISFFYNCSTLCVFGITAKPDARVIMATSELFVTLLRRRPRHWHREAQGEWGPGAAQLLREPVWLSFKMRKSSGFSIHGSSKKSLWSMFHVRASTCRTRHPRTTTEQPSVSFTPHTNDWCQMFVVFSASLMYCLGSIIIYLDGYPRCIICLYKCQMFYTPPCTLACFSCPFFLAPSFHDLDRLFFVLSRRKQGVKIGLRKDRFAPLAGTTWRATLVDMYIRNSSLQVAKYKRNATVHPPLPFLPWLSFSVYVSIVIGRSSRVAMGHHRQVVTDPMCIVFIGEHSSQTGLI